MNEHLLQTQLKEYAASAVPLHMPGHKRKGGPVPGLPYSWDVTEVPGTDDLHDPQGILAQAMERTARLFGAKKTWYLVNGSTCGLLAAIRALAPYGSQVIVARNCHKAVYHALELGNLSSYWLLPPILDGFNIYGGIPAASVEEALNACPKAKCVILTSPTYEGVLSDIGAIARLCHQRDIPLLVDEAHGAHLGLFPAGGFPPGALSQGADVVVQSAHKTLPSLTQTALLHWNSQLVSPEALARQLEIFETSSPSYPLLASLDGCTGLLKNRGEALFSAWAEALAGFDEKAKMLCRFQVLCHGADSPSDHPGLFAYDKSKLLVNCRGIGKTGNAVAQSLRSSFRIETEMAQGENVLAMTGLSDEPRLLEGFAEALLQLEQEAPPCLAAASPLCLPSPGEAPLSIAEALARPQKELPLAKAAGELAGEYVSVYPPGVPLLTPGEAVTGEFLVAAEALEAQGSRLHFSHSKGRGYLRVIT